MAKKKTSKTNKKIQDKKFKKPTKEKKIKEKKVKKDKKPLGHRISEWLKDFIKNLKRVRWAKGKDLRKSFILTAIFIVVISLVLFGLATGFSSMWNALGVGINE